MVMAIRLEDRNDSTILTQQRRIAEAVGFNTWLSLMHCPFRFFVFFSLFLLGEGVSSRLIKS